MRLPLLFAALLTASLSTACLSTEPLVIPTIETTGFDPSLGVNLAASTRTASGLYYRDIAVGTDTVTFAAGRTVGVYYVGALTNGTVFDSRTSASGTGPFSFKLGAGQVIAGWDEGLVGMKVGGQRQLIVPSSLAYGASALSDANGIIVIPSYSILVFTVTAVSAQ